MSLRILAFIFPFLLGTATAKDDFIAGVPKTSIQKSKEYAKKRVLQLSSPQRPIKLRHKLINRIVARQKDVRIKKLNKDEITKRQQFLHGYLYKSSTYFKALFDTDNPDHNMTLFESTTYGVKTYGFLWQTKKSNASKNLIIYHLGHGYTGNDELNFYNEAIKNGFDILIIGMPGLTININYNQFPAKFSKNGNFLDLQLNGFGSQSHGNYRFFYDKKNPNLDPISLFISGNYYLINKLAPKYDNIIMVGLSGGGWSTSIIAALNTNIAASWSYAGSIPLAFRINGSNTGDWEQIESSIWRDYDYWDFYILSLVDKNGKFRRSHSLVHHDKDKCCFKDPLASEFSAIVKDLSLDGLSAEVIEQTQHMVDYKLAFKKINQWLKEKKN